MHHSNGHVTAAFFKWRLKPPGLSIEISTWSSVSAARGQGLCYFKCTCSQWTFRSRTTKSVQIFHCCLYLTSIAEIYSKVIEHSLQGDICQKRSCQEHGQEMLQDTSCGLGPSKYKPWDHSHDFYKKHLLKCTLKALGTLFNWIKDLGIKAQEVMS